MTESMHTKENHTYNQLAWSKLLTPDWSQAPEITYHLTGVVADHLMNSQNGIQELHGSYPQYDIKQMEQIQL